MIFINRFSLPLLENDANGFSELPTSPEHGFKSGIQFVRIVTHNFPERFAIVARPREEKFILFTEAGVFKSSVLPNAGVIYGENTLNSSRNISLQVREHFTERRLLKR